MKNMLKNITMSLEGVKNLIRYITILLALVLVSCSNGEVIPTTTTEVSAERPPEPISTFYHFKKSWLDITWEDSTFILTMPYATDKNFLKEKIYPCAKCLLRKDAGEALLKAQKEALSKGYKIIIFDCYRPLPLQQKMFDIKPDTKYIADPKRGSKHNKGVAVDISLADMDGKPLDMGTGFDNFSEKASYHSTTVSAEAKKNRKLLRELMLANDFTPYDNEWWHFNYKKTDYPNEDFVWDCDE